MTEPPEPLAPLSPATSNPTVSPPWRKWVYGVLLALLLGVIGWYYWQAIDTEVLGFTHDDGVYALVGKALAQGRGFTLLHVIGEPPQVKYPFIFPLLLSFVWLFKPFFPENLLALNAVPFGFTLASCALLYVYLRQSQRFPGWLCLLIIALVTGSFFFIYFFSTVMSEAPYLFFSLATLWYAHRAVHGEQPTPRHTVLLLILLSALTFLTRVTGIALIASIGVWFLLNRQWKNAVIYGIGTLLLGVLPWFLWIKFQTPAINDLNYPLVHTYSNYGLEFAHNYKAGGYWLGIYHDLHSMMERLLEDMLPVIPNALKMYPWLNKLPNASLIHVLVGITCTYLVFGYFVLQGIHAVRKSGEGKRFNPQAFSIPGMYLFFYMLLITLWHYGDQMARFLTVVTPLLWMYFFKPMLHLLPEWGQPLPRDRRKMGACLALTVVVSTVALWACPSSYKTIYTSRNQHWVENGKYRWMWQEYQHTFAWINRELPPDASLAAFSDTVFYLYTNRPTFYLFYASLRRANNEFLQESFPLLLKSMDHYKVSYMVAEPHMQARQVTRPVNIVASELMARFPGRFERVYSSPKGAIQIYKILRPEPVAQSVKQ